MFEVITTLVHGAHVGRRILALALRGMSSTNIGQASRCSKLVSRGGLDADLHLRSHSSPKRVLIEKPIQNAMPKN